MPTQKKGLQMLHAAAPFLSTMLLAGLAPTFMVNRISSLLRIL